MDRRSLGLFAVVAVFFGGTFVAAKAGLAYFPPLTFVALRFDIAALLLGGYVLATRSPSALWPRSRGDWLGIIATGGFVIGLANALLFVGQQHTTSAVGAVLFSLIPILTPVVAAVLLPATRISRRETLGLLVGLAGVVLVINPDPAMLTGGTASGRAIIFAGAFSAATGAVLIRRAEATLSSTVRIAWGLPLAAAISHVLAIAAGESPTAITWAPAGILALAYVAVAAGVFAYVAYFALLDTAGPIRANLVFYAVPVVSTLGGIVLLGESTAPTTVAGFLVIAIGFGVIGSESVDLGALRRRITEPDHSPQPQNRSRSD